MKYDVRRIAAGEWRELRSLRLEALQDSPEAFSTRYTDAVALADHSWQEEARRAATAPDDGLFVAVDEDGVWVGTAGAAPLTDIPDTAHVHAVYVSPAHRGPDGPARALMAAAVGFAREHIARTHLTLGVREDNHRARAFYRRLGFTETGTTVPYPLDPAKRLCIMACPDFRTEPR
ncbi:GNAT family N-acetyltransferase [Kitasatospora paracochleata]|uniref:Ribosomal protein S18 acetylase RimI-like enzyme n=1 Tax=Kitasatospora paracochleata TaxID=58354 RepID=A0ABT1J1P5_9ACTN|nr:GNAT family N-acetyltransferase [Kitasatospora paracochleata]MCP2311298.1 ribosomal protein S18 acetylase RimI-like enzyme [Kitasatospora paracochleata]